MKDRITLGHDADVAETAALTLADNRATERVYAALDWEQEEKGRKGLINNAIRRLAKKDRPFPCSPPSAHLQPNHRPQPLDVQAYFLKS